MASARAAQQHLALSAMAQQRRFGQHVSGCVAFALVGIGVNTLFNVLAPRRWLEDVSGSPRYSWWIGCTFQIVILPAFFILSVQQWWSHSGYDSTPVVWLNAEWDQIGSAPHALFHYAFFGYLAKDMAIPMTAVLYAHHIVCLILIVL